MYNYAKKAVKKSRRIFAGAFSMSLKFKCAEVKLQGKRVFWDVVAILYLKKHVHARAPQCA